MSDHSAAPTRVRKTDLFAALPPEWAEDPLPAIRQAVHERGERVVVLDDDPTGTQTVHDVPVLTRWSVEALRDELAAPSPVFYLLTNSRSLPPAQARTLNVETGRMLLEAARLARRGFVVISRSDSTLRGHYPGEVEALAEGLGGRFDALLIAPAFFPGGRYTIGDVHYVADGEWLIPAGQTQFARDVSFGYRASDLRQWVAEKTGGRVPAGAVASLSIELMRRGGPGAVCDALLALPAASVCIVNAASERDLAVATLGILWAEARGRRFLYRTAASIVPLRAGIGSRPLLTPGELDLPNTAGGLVVVGSHVPRTTSQVEWLIQKTGVDSIEVRVEALLSDGERLDEVARVARGVEQALDAGRDVAIYTSRRLVTGAGAESSLAIGQRISEGLTRIVGSVAVRPRYILAKGGITSSDVATEGLGVRRALVLGQILPGVPVWRLGSESRHPGLAYIVFPGNVGGPEALAAVVEALRLEDRQDARGNV